MSGDAADEAVRGREGTGNKLTLVAMIGRDDSRELPIVRSGGYRGFVEEGNECADA
jgi:hypothetical protein